MRFFTPELFVRFNSPDEDEADGADEAWEAAVRGYRDHLDGVRDRMPSPVKKLAGLCLHDAELLASDQVIEPAFPGGLEPFGPPPYWSALELISVEQAGRMVTLIYVLWDRVREHPAGDGWRFSKRRAHWLYDEIDTAADRRGAFLHRILVSDGRVLEVPFSSVFIHTVPLAHLTGRGVMGEPVA